MSKPTSFIQINVKTNTILPENFLANLINLSVCIRFKYLIEIIMKPVLFTEKGGGKEKKQFNLASIIKLVNQNFIPLDILSPLSRY